MNDALTNLITKLTEANARTAQWIAQDPKNRWASMYILEPQFWIERGITTIEQFDRNELITNIFEGTQDIFGYKPSWTALTEMSTDALQMEWDALKVYAQRQREAEENSTTVLEDMPWHPRGR